MFKPANRQQLSSKWQSILNEFDLKKATFHAWVRLCFNFHVESARHGRTDAALTEPARPNCAIRSIERGRRSSTSSKGPPMR